ncbi:MAG: hypothetical protein JSV03_13325 [Planctomycetota bacterium]|nr:MAG: hypothetical protein JSV03_13325 [Planctomycetota bacterium]
MTTITKIFVILVCLFAFIFTPVAVYFAGTTYDWKELAEQYRELAQTALAREMNALAVTASEIQHYKSLRDQEHNRLMEARQKIDNLDRKINTMIQERDQLNRSRDNWETSARLLTAELAVLNNHNQELTKTKEKMLADERVLRADNNWLTGQNKDHEATIEILNQKLYQLKERIAYQAEENEKLRNQLNLGRADSEPLTTPTPSAKSVTPAAPSPIYGRVIEVRGRMASIDVGSASGVQEGTTMIVMRGSKYICDLKITSVTPNEAVGEIGLTGGDLIRVNDQVVDLDSFQSRQ